MGIKSLGITDTVIPTDSYLGFLRCELLKGSHLLSLCSFGEP